MAEYLSCFESPRMNLTSRTERKCMNPVKFHTFVKKIDDFRANTTKKDAAFN